MGRNHRHKKDLKAEKGKVKLKQSKTKFLPKGLNVTKTNFKIKPIVLVEQLKEKDIDSPLSKRKLNIKDLLSRIKHYNENVRHGACEELVEMIKFYSEDVINQHLSQIILSVSTLMQDRERKVRKAAVKVVNAILEFTPEDKVKPFFGYFSTNMRCAMTNIDRSVQEDSLLFLDCFLKYNSGLISECSEKLLPDFFTLISKLRSDSNLERTLTVNLGSKMTSVTWRIKVLSRLHAVLETVLYSHIGETNGKIDVNKCYNNADECNTFPIYKHSFAEVLDYTGLSNGSNQNNFDGTDVLNRHIITLVPLLYETWIEVVPDKKIGKAVTESTVLSEETSAILACIMNTLYLLWKYVIKIENDTINVKNVFLSNEGRKFLDHLLTNFPYSQIENKSKQKINPGLKVLEINTDPKCIRENILICYMYCVLHINYLHRNLRIEMAAITEYISKCLVTKRYIDQSNAKYLMEFLRTCLVENPQLWKRAGADLKMFLDISISFYYHVVSEKCKMEVFNILSNVAEAVYLKKSQHYNSWLSALPKLLCESKITDSLVEGVLKFSRKGNGVFHRALLKQLPKILENLECMSIVLTNISLDNNEEVVKRNIVNIFFFIPVLYKEQLQEISNFIMKHPQSTYCQYFVDMLKLRLEMKSTKHFEAILKQYPFWKCFN